MRSIQTLPLALALAVSGCSLFAPTSQVLTITTPDPKAEISVDGQLVGLGAVAVPVARNRGHAILGKSPAGSFVTHYVGTKISPTGVLDVVGGIFLLFPFVGLAGPGFYQLDQDVVILSLPVTPGTPAPTVTVVPAAATLPEKPPPKALDRRIRDERDYAWPGLD